MATAAANNNRLRLRAVEYPELKFDLAGTNLKGLLVTPTTPSGAGERLVRPRFQEARPRQWLKSRAYPILRGGYDPEYFALAELTNETKLIDNHTEAETVSLVGIKYSCFHLVEKEKAQK